MQIKAHTHCNVKSFLGASSLGPLFCYILKEFSLLSVPFLHFLTHQPIHYYIITDPSLERNCSLRGLHVLNLTDVFQSLRSSRGKPCSQDGANKPVKPVKLKSVKGKVRWEKLFIAYKRPDSVVSLLQLLSLCPSSPVLECPRLSPTPSGRNSIGGAPATDRCQTKCTAEGRKGQLLSTPCSWRLPETAAVNTYCVK